MPNSKSQAGTKVQQRTKAEVTTSNSHNAKPNVSRSRLFADEIDWFEKVNITETNIKKLRKDELLELVLILHQMMIDSTDNWEGG